MEYFFVFGLPKSGTTWLQMLLNAHPGVSCRAEDQLGFFVQHLPQLLEAYDKHRAGVNERTAQQEIQPYSEQDAKQIFKSLVETTLDKAFYRGSTVQASGTKDNSILDNLDFYSKIFPTAKYIHIIRDPRDITISSWHHNMRVEPKFIARAHSLEEWAVGTAKDWKQAMENINQTGKTYCVRYEDLKEDTVDEAKKLFKYLEVDYSKAGSCVEATRFSKMKKTGNKFFRKGETGSWEKELDSEMLEGMKAEAGEEMRKWGYI